MVSHWSGPTSAQFAHDVAGSHLDGDLDTVIGAPGPQVHSSEFLLPVPAHRVSQSVLLSSNFNTSSGSDAVHGLVGVQLPKGREVRAI